jgi:hypothetical protein
MMVWGSLQVWGVGVHNQAPSKLWGRRARQPQRTTQRRMEAGSCWVWVLAGTLQPCVLSAVLPLFKAKGGQQLASWHYPRPSHFFPVYSIICTNELGKEALEIGFSNNLLRTHFMLSLKSTKKLDNTKTKRSNPTNSMKQKIHLAFHCFVASLIPSQTAQFPGFQSENGRGGLLCLLTLGNGECL